MELLEIGVKTLKPTEIYEVAVAGRKVGLADESIQKVINSQEYLQAQIEQGRTFYGVNTGFGAAANIPIEKDQLKQLQKNIIRSHSAGSGDPLEEKYVRAMLLLRANALAIGNSGVSVNLISQIVRFLNSGICPLVPSQGSVGASGDLAPLAHLSLPLLGEGEVYFKGKRMPAGEALQSCGIDPIELQAKEGLALINGTQFMTALGVMTMLEAEYLCDLADFVGAMSLEAVRGTSDPFETEIHMARPHPGQLHVAKRLKSILQGAGASEIARSHENCHRVQDAYSFRCMPQVHGASRDVLAFVSEVLERETNSVTDNPLVFPRAEKILSGGNFHGQIVSIALDTMAIAAAELGSISEQRFSKMINPAISELPMFLTKNEGLNSGFMIVHVNAASIVSENKTLCHPASVDSISTNVDKEDHVSMGAWASRKAKMVVRNSRRVLAMELLAAAQGIELLRPLKTSPVLERLHGQVRSAVPALQEDRPFNRDIEKIEKMIFEREFELEV